MHPLLQLICGPLLAIALGAYLLPVSQWLARQWLRLWTRSLPPELRQRRIGEIESHLFEIAAAGKAEGLRPSEIGLNILVSTLLGVPGDLLEFGVRTDWSGLALVCLKLSVSVMARVLAWVIAMDRLPVDRERSRRIVSLVTVLVVLAASVLPYLLVVGHLSLDAALSLEFGTAARVTARVFSIVIALFQIVFIGILAGSLILLLIYFLGPGHPGVTLARKRLGAVLNDEAAVQELRTASGQRDQNLGDDLVDSCG